MTFFSAPAPLAYLCAFAERAGITPVSGVEEAAPPELF
jgi:hypothetical protein